MERPFTGRAILIPQLVQGFFTGRPYKAELVLMRSLDGGARQHVWFDHDRRPHNHPWEWIDCKLLRGQYTAFEVTPRDGDFMRNFRIITLKAGDPEHRVSHDTFHQITEVEPGTISVMSFGPIVGDGKQWGHLVKDPGDGTHYEQHQPSSSFLDALRHLNPHMRPHDWIDPFADMPVPSLDELMAHVGL